MTDPAARTPAVWNTASVEGVGRIIAVASGKGGVGKSTVALHLAYAIAAMGPRVALLDADIYGPSLPHMMGLPLNPPPLVAGKMQPPEAHGVACMSIGLLLPNAPAVLRGPMITKTLHQLLRQTAWGARDLLLVDMPPGTGDVHLSLAQACRLAGVVLVTTPQEVALLDARKAAQMFGKVDVPILGVIENMSGEVFGRGGGAKLAAEFSTSLLAEIPLDPAIRAACDAGRPAPLAPYAAAATRLVATWSAR